MFEMFLTFYWMVWLITLLSLNLWIALSSVWSRCFEHPRFCDEFSHLLNARFVAAPCTEWIPNWIQFMFEMFSTIYWIVWLIKMLSMNLRFVLWSVWSRCFWASQILWWILTSTECTICCSSKHLMNSQLNTIHVWNVFNDLLNCLTY